MVLNKTRRRNTRRNTQRRNTRRRNTRRRTTRRRTTRRRTTRANKKKGRSAPAPPKGPPSGGAVARGSMNARSQQIITEMPSGWGLDTLESSGSFNNSDIQKLMNQTLDISKVDNAESILGDTLKEEFDINEEDLASMIQDVIGNPKFWNKTSGESTGEYSSDPDHA